VVKWRQTAAKLWSLLAALGLVLVHSVTANHSPVTDLCNFALAFVLHLFAPSFWLYASVLLATLWLLASFNDALFRVTPKVYPNNLDKLLHNLYSLHSLCILSHAAGSLLSAYLLLKFYEPDTPIQRAYVCGFCALSTFLLKLQSAFEEKYMLSWPIIEQTKYFRFKSKVYGLALGQLKAVLFHMLVWKVLCFFVGSCVLSSLFAPSPPAATAGSAFQTTLVALKLAFLLNLSHSLAWLIYEIYLTEIYHFNVQPNVHSAFSLPASMALSAHAYIQTLAFLDFAHTSVYSKAKRKQIFSLSHTTNQPTNWFKVSTEALKVLNDFIEIFSFDDMLHGSPPPPYSLAAGSCTLRRTINATSPLRDHADLAQVKAPGRGQAPKPAEATLLNSCSQKVS